MTKTRRKKQNFRDIINVPALIDALEKHVLGEREMSASQVTAALALLKKTLPDISGKETDTGGGHEEALKDLA